MYQNRIAAFGKICIDRITPKTIYKVSAEMLFFSVNKASSSSCKRFTVTFHDIEQFTTHQVGKIKLKNPQSMFL